jgi:acyl-[acyl-carrier-protein] desaturase
MVHTAAGYNSGDKSMLEALAYVSFQELATRISHRSTGRASGCPVAEQLLTRVATDENLHIVFYRNLVDAAFDIAPNATMQAIAREVVNFQMPGSTMPGFAENVLTIAKAGIYDLRSHLDDVVRPVLRFWRVFERDDLDGDGEHARNELAAFLDLVEDKAAHYERRREERMAGAASGRSPPVLLRASLKSSHGPALIL